MSKAGKLAQIKQKLAYTFIMSSSGNAIAMNLDGQQRVTQPASNLGVKANICFLYRPIGSSTDLKRYPHRPCTTKSRHLSNISESATLHQHTYEVTRQVIKAVSKTKHIQHPNNLSRDSITGKIWNKAILWNMSYLVQADILSRYHPAEHTRVMHHLQLWRSNSGPGPKLRDSRDSNRHSRY